MKIIVNILLGLLIFCLIMLAMLAVSILVKSSEGGDPTKFISTYALASALPVLLFSFLLAFLLKTRKGKDAILRGIIWTAVAVAAYFLIGLGNQTLPFIFGALGTYVQLAAVFLGPIAASLIKRK